MKVIDIKNCNVFLDSTQVLHDFSFSVNEGEHIGVIGPNGAGKSTFIRLLMNDIWPARRDNDNPEVEILSRDDWSIVELRQEIALISPRFGDALLTASPLTIFDAVASSFFGSYGFFADDKINVAQAKFTEEILQKLNLAEIREQSIHELSTGQLRKVLVARAMVLQPKIILLDEPTSGLDIAAQYEFMQFIRRHLKDCTVILVTHHLEEILPEIEKILLIKNGRIFKFGVKEEILTQENLSKLFEVNLHLNISEKGIYSMSVE